MSFRDPYLVISFHHLSSLDQAVILRVMLDITDMIMDTTDSSSFPMEMLVMMLIVSFL